MPFGVLSTGFSAKPLATIVSELESAFKAGPLGESAGSESDGSIPAQSIAGQEIAIMADGLAAQWELQEAVYNALDPTGATDAALDQVCALSGTVRDAASYSTVTCTCTGTAGTILPAQRIATVTDSLTRFESRGQITGAAAWQASTAYVVGDVVTNLVGTETRYYQCITAGTSAASGGPTTTNPDITDGTVHWAWGQATLANITEIWVALTDYVVGDFVDNAGNTYRCITAGTSAGAGGPTTTAADITDGTVHWRYLGADTIGATDVLFQAEDAGALAAAADTLVTIGTPVSGWSSLHNQLAATPGALVESDPALRIRRESELASQGNATADAIRADVLEVAGVTHCTVFYNDTDSTDADGRPPHSVHALVLGGTDAAVAAGLFATVGAGIAYHGATSVVVQDSQGNNRTVKFDRPTEKRVYIICNVTYLAADFPADTSVGEAGIKGSIVTYGDTFLVGQDVRSAALSARVFTGPISTSPGAVPIPGILDVTALYIGLAPAPGSEATIVIANDELATFAVGDITVNLTPGTL
jgi:uncharacterized phage protein gp47/JayE